MFLFIFYLVVAAGGAGFVGGVLIVGARAYDAGWNAHAHEQSAVEADKRRAGFRVVRDA